MKLSSLVADWLATVNPRVYALCGAGAMHLNDAIARHPGLQVTAMQHEQAAAFAAEADARVSGRPGIVHVTAGPGGTNALTGVASAYVDSIPMIVIAGQVTTDTLKSGKLRQRGMNELDLVSMVRPITKYAVTVMRPEDIQFELDYALHEATTGRPGPVWVEIPLNVQAAEVDPNRLVRYAKRWPAPASDDQASALTRGVRSALDLLAGAERPVLIIGNGVRLAGGCEDCRTLVDALQIPVVSSWTASDIVPTDHPCYIGRAGIFGCRAANLAVQNADFILAVGTRLSIPQTGHAIDLFAPKARKVVVDIDCAEAAKLPHAIPVVADAKVFLAAMLTELGQPVTLSRQQAWLRYCRYWRARYPVMREEYRAETTGVNAYAFVEELGKHLPDDAIVVTDVGAAFIATMQSLPLKLGQRLFHSGGVSAMGYGLPAAIGACLAGGKKRKVVCLTGDGGLMLNLQELQTIAHHNLPITIFVFVNGGYMTIQHMQDNHFGRHVLSSPESGMSLPNFARIATAFEIESWKFWSRGALAQAMDILLASDQPILCQLHLPADQRLIPRVQSKIEDGQFVTTPIDDMFPYLEREELAMERA